MNNDSKNPQSSQPEIVDPQNNELQACTEQLAAAKERYVYALAEFDNYKKRTEKDRALWISSAQGDILCELLTIADNFERALKDPGLLQKPELADYLDGFVLIEKELFKILARYDVEEIVCSTEFDPTYHEAVMQAVSADHKPGQIIQVLQKGYKRKQEVLRPAKVSVAQEDEPKS